MRYPNVIHLRNVPPELGSAMYSKANGRGWTYLQLLSQWNELHEAIVEMAQTDQDLADLLAHLGLDRKAI